MCRASGSGIYPSNVRSSSLNISIVLGHGSIFDSLYGITSLRFHLTLGIKQHERSPTLQLIDLVVTFADVPEALAVL